MEETNSLDMNELISSTFVDKIKKKQIYKSGGNKPIGYERMKDRNFS